MRYYNIAAAVCAVIGLVLVFVGWDMGNGHFWGKTYEKGNFATLYAGLVWIVGAVILFAIPRIFDKKLFAIPRIFDKKPRRKKYVVETEPDLNLGSWTYDFIRVIASISLIVGVISIIVSFPEENFMALQFGLKCVVGSPILFALSYITEAACVFIAKNKPRKKMVAYYDEDDDEEEVED